VSTRDRLRELAQDVARSCRGHDLLLYSAGVTFYATIGIVPLLLLSLFLGGLLVGEQTVQMMATGLAEMLPSAFGAQDAARGLVGAGVSMSPLAALAALLPASLYGEGLVRAFDRLSRSGDSGRRSLRGRLGALVVVAASPLLLLAGLAAQTALSRVLGDSGIELVVGVYASFLVGWLSVSVLLLYAYRGLAPERPGPRALLWGALSTGSFVAGTSLGWMLFLVVDAPLGGVYGGSDMLAAAAVTALWLYLLHVMVLVGYVLTLRLAAREGRPLGDVVLATTVREAA
jgi:membrane protein